MLINMNYTDLPAYLSSSTAPSTDDVLNLYANDATATIEPNGPNDYLDVRTRLNNFMETTNETVQLDPVLIERFTRNQSIDYPWYQLLIAMYSGIIIFGSLGNILVVIAVLRKPIMRTARNLFILNLAISDLLLCLVTMPLTLMEILSKFWPFGSCAILCKMIAMLQALSIFVSTISITAIAFDRYQVIVYPTRDSLQFFGAVAILVGIWLLALLLASPMFIYKRLIHAEIPQMLQALGIHGVSFCIEDWPVNHGRFYYSIFSLCVQYLVPILIVSGAYFGIYNKLKNRITVVAVQATSSHRKAERGRRMKRTNCLLISIAIIFGVSWLPLNFFNLYADMKRSAVTQRMLVTYAICHMIGMSSACSNPLLYGWLNDNFRKEFQELLCRCKETTNVAPLNGHNAGGGQTRRRRKHADIAKGDLKLLTGSGGGGGCGAGGGAGVGGCDVGGVSGYSGAGRPDVYGRKKTRHDADDVDDDDDDGIDTNHQSFITGSGLRSVVTESVALTENPLSTEVTQLMPRNANEEFSRRREEHVKHVCERLRINENMAEEFMRYQ